MSSTEAQRRALIVTLSLVFAVLSGCDDSATPVALTECRPNQFRRCEAECGRGVEQCVEPGRWNGCACAVLDAGFVSDARKDRDTSDARDGEPADAPIDGGEGSPPSEGGDSEVSDAPPG